MLDRSLTWVWNCFDLRNAVLIRMSFLASEIRLSSHPVHHGEAILVALAIRETGLDTSKLSLHRVAVVDH